MNIATKAVIKSFSFNGSMYLLQLRDNKKEIFSPNHWGNTAIWIGGTKNNNETSKKAIKREHYLKNWVLIAYI